MLVAFVPIQARPDAITDLDSRLDGVIDTTTMIAFRQYSTAELDASYDDFVG